MLKLDRLAARLLFGLDFLSPKSGVDADMIADCDMIRLNNWVCRLVRKAHPRYYDYASNFEINLAHRRL